MVAKAEIPRTAPSPDSPAPEDRLNPADYPEKLREFIVPINTLTGLDREQRMNLLFYGIFYIGNMNCDKVAKTIGGNASREEALRRIKFFLDMPDSELKEVWSNFRRARATYNRHDLVPMDETLKDRHIEVDLPNGVSILMGQIEAKVLRYIHSAETISTLDLARKVYPDVDPKLVQKRISSTVWLLRRKLQEHGYTIKNVNHDIKKRRAAYRFTAFTPDL